MTSCSLIGQSNSIYESGFFGRMRSNEALEFRHLGRLGASPSAIGPYFGASEGFFDVQYCLIDCCIIDVTEVGFGSCSLASVGGWIEWIGQKARSRGCQPIFVLICPIQHLDADDPTLALYRSVIDRFGFYYLDVRDVAAAMVAEAGSRGSLYRDGAHPGDALSQRMADILATFIASNHFEGCERVQVDVDLKRFEAVRLQTARPELTTVSYPSHILPFDGVRLNEGEVLVLNTGPFRRVHAIVVNASHAHRMVAFRGAGRVVKNLNLKPYGAGGYEARLVTLSEPVGDDNGRLQLAVLRGARASEPTFHVKPAFSPLATTIELGDLLIETGSDHLSFATPRPPAPLNNIVPLASSMERA